MYCHRVQGYKNLAVCLVFFLHLSRGKDLEGSVRSQDTLEDLGLNDDVARRGEVQLESYQSKNSPCWMKAVEELQRKCSQMNDIEQSILAIKFSNCHFEKSGMKTYNCTDKADFQRCTRAMKEEDFTSFLAYTEFFTHVTSICYYLQSEIWRQKTAETISMLSSTTEETIEKLDKSLINQDLVLESQNKSLLNQQKILKNEEKLKATLENSTESAKAAFDQMKQRADEQQAIFSRTFDGIFGGIKKLEELQTILLGEFITLQSVAFYIISIVSCYLVTNSPRTSEARIYLMFFFGLLVFAEKMIVNHPPASNNLHIPINEWIHKTLWLARYFFIGLSLSAVLFFAIQYKDLNRMNNKILCDIQERLIKIQEAKFKERRKETTVHSVDGNGCIDSNSGKDHPTSSTAVVTKHANCIDSNSGKDHLTSSTPVVTKHANLPVSTCEPLQFESDVSLEDTADPKSQSELSPMERALFSDESDGEGGVPGKILKHKRFSMENFVKGNTKSKKRKVHGDKGKITSRDDSSIPAASRYSLRARSASDFAKQKLVYETKNISKSQKKASMSKAKKVEMGSLELFSSDEEY